MSLIWVVILVSFSFILIMVGYYQNVPLTYSQTDYNSIRNVSINNSIFGGDRFTNIEYPSLWDKLEIPEINGVLFLSPLKTVGAIVQNITGKNITSDELYTNLLLSMRQNLNEPNILSSNTTKNLVGSDIETVEYSYGSDPKKFKILHILETSTDQAYSFTYFAEDVLYDRFLPIVATMKNTFFYTNDNEKPIVKHPLRETNTSPDQTRPEKSTVINSEVESTNQLTQNPPNLDRNLTYNNPYLGISFKYPSSLTKTEGDTGVSFTLDQGNSGIIIGFVPSSFNSLENFTSERVSNLESTLKDFKITNMSQTNIFTNPTQLLLFNYDNNSRLYEGLEFITMDRTDGYIFTYFSSANTFDRNVSLFADMIESIQLRNLPRID